MMTFPFCGEFPFLRFDPAICSRWGRLRRALYGRQTVAGGVCLRQATIGVRTGAATPTSSVTVLPSLFGTQRLPELSIATPNGPMKLDPAGANLPNKVPSLLSAVTVLPLNSSPRRGPSCRLPRIVLG